MKKLSPILLIALLGGLLLTFTSSSKTSAQSPPLGPTLVTEQAGSRIQSNTKVLNFASGCTVTASGTTANVSCSGSGGDGGAGGTVTSVSNIDGTLALTPNPIVSTGIIGIDLTHANTWTGSTVFAKPFTGTVSGTSLPWSLTPSVTGDGGIGGNTATPVLCNLSPTVNLASTGGTNSSGYTGLLVNITETAIGSGTKKLLDLEVGGVTKAAVGSTGALWATSFGSSSGNQNTVPAVNGDTFALVAAVQTLTNKTLTTPTIASFTNATHDHTNAAGGGTLGSNTAAATQISSSSFRLFFSTARNGAGNFTLTGVKANDEIAQVVDLSNGPGGGGSNTKTSSFATVAPADNTLSQTAATDFSASGLVFLIIAKGG